MNEEIIQKITKFREELSTYIQNSFTNKKAIIDTKTNLIKTVSDLIDQEIQNNKQILTQPDITTILANSAATTAKIEIIRSQ